MTEVQKSEEREGTLYDFARCAGKEAGDIIGSMISVCKNGGVLKLKSIVATCPGAG